MLPVEAKMNVSARRLKFVTSRVNVVAGAPLPDDTSTMILAGRDYTSNRADTGVNVRTRTVCALPLSLRVRVRVTNRAVRNPGPHTVRLAAQPKVAELNMAFYQQQILKFQIAVHLFSVTRKSVGVRVRGGVRVRER